MINPLFLANTITITIRRRSGTDRYGDDLPPTTHEVPGCFVEPRILTNQPSEVHTNRNTVISALSLYGPYDADVEPEDVAILPDGTEWYVEGSPGRWRHPFSGWQAGMTVNLARVTG